MTSDSIDHGLSLSICNNALNYWYDIKIEGCKLSSEARKILDEQQQVEKHLFEAFQKAFSSTKEENLK